MTSCAPKLGRGPSQVDAITYVGAYPPLYYALVGWPSLLFAPRLGIYVMRLVSGLICAALLASGIASALRMSRRLFLTGCVLALTPMVVFLAGSINPSSVEIAAGFSLWTSLLLVVTQPDQLDTRIIFRVLLAGILLTATRILSPAFLVVIVGVVLLAAGDRAKVTRLWADRRLRAVAGVIALVAALCTAYIIVNRSYSSFIGWPAVKNAFEETGGRVEQQVGLFGWNNIALPHWLTLGWIAAVVALAVAALVVGRWRDRAVLAATVLGCLALPILAQMLNNGKYKPSWQGRYALPLSIGVPILAGWICDQSERVPRIAERTAAVCVAVAASVAYVVAHQTLMARNITGLPNRLFDGIHDYAWVGPLAPIWLFVGIVCVSLAYATWLTILAGVKVVR